MAKDKLFGQDTVAGAKEVKNAAAEISKIMGGIDMSKMSKPMQQVAKASRDMSKELANSEKYSKENVKLAKQQSKASLLGVKYATSTNKLSKIFRSFQIQRSKGEDEFTKGLQESATEFNDMVAAAKDLGGALKEAGGELAEGFGDFDELFGGIGSAIGGFVTNPLTIAVALMTQFNSTQEAIAKEFGAIGVTEFREELAGAQQEFTKLGLEADAAGSTITQLANDFGVSFDKAIGLSETIGDLSVSTGLAVEDSTSLVGIFTELGGLTGEQASNLAKSAQSLAVANGVAPSAVLKDIADNAEFFAKFSGDGAEGMARAAIQAKKLGIELSDVAGSMESMLDFQSSLNAEVQASAMLGRNVNLQRARELALAGKTEDFQKEILRIVGSQAQFDKMNVLQKKALADATGISVDKLAKMVSKEKEAATLAGELEKQDISKMVPEETLTNTAQILADFQVMGMQLAEQIGPSLIGMVSAFGSIVGFLLETKVVLPIIIGFMVTLKILSLAVAIANTFSTAMKSFKDIPIVGIALGIGAAIAAIGTIVALVGDAVVPAGDKPMVSPAGSPNMLVGRKDDDILMAPGIAGAKAAGGGGTTNVTNVDNSGIEKQGAQTNQKLDQLISVMLDQPKKIGKKVGSRFDSLKNS